jgi:hypothetical protein
MRRWYIQYIMKDGDKRVPLRIHPFDTKEKAVEWWNKNYSKLDAASGGVVPVDTAIDAFDVCEYFRYMTIVRYEDSGCVLSTYFTGIFRGS